MPDLSTAHATTHGRPDVNFGPLDATTPRTAADAPASLTVEEAQHWADGYNAALRHLGDQFIVVWSGGLEADLGLYAFRNQAAARTKYDECAANTRDAESRVDLVRVTPDGKVTQIDTHTADSPVLGDTLD